MPTTFDFFLKILKIAAAYRADDVVMHIYKTAFTRHDARQVAQLFNLLCHEFAEYFRSVPAMQSIRMEILNRLSFKCKALLRACISGDMDVFLKTKSVGYSTDNGYFPFITYAAANDQAELVRHLAEIRKHLRTAADLHSDPMAVSIINNSNRVFDYLIQTHQPNRQLFAFYGLQNKVLQRLISPSRGGFVTLLQLAIAVNNQNYFERLMEKGEELSDSTFRIAIRAGNKDILECCQRMGKPLPAESLTIAIEARQYHLISYLQSKVFDINGLDKSGYSYLCAAVIANNAPIVKELLSLGADVMACNSEGEHAVLIAAQAQYPTELLKMLLDHLKTKLSAEDLAAFLNKPIKGNHTILHYFANNYVIPPSSNRRKNIHYLICNIKLLIDHGLSLITAQFGFSYCDDVNFCVTTVNMHVLHCFVYHQLLKNCSLTLAHLNIILALEKYFSSSGRHVFEKVEFLSPDLAMISKWLFNLVGAEKYQELLIERVDYLLLQINNAKSIAESLKLFNALVAICGDYLAVFQERLNLASPQTSLRINLCLLLVREPQAKIRNFLGVYLNHLKGRNLRKLIILAHILTYYHSTVAQPDQIRTLFLKGLAELANINLSENDTIESLAQTHPKKLLIAILQMRYQFVLLFTEKSESMFAKLDFVNQQEGKLLLVTLKQINKIISESHRYLASSGLTISESYLSSIFEYCVKNLFFADGKIDLIFQDVSDEVDSATGKQARNEGDAIGLSTEPPLPSVNKFRDM